MKKIIGLLLVIGVLFGLHYLVRGSYAYRHIRVDFEGYRKHIGSHFALSIYDLEHVGQLNHDIGVVMYLPEPKQWMHLYRLTMVTPEGQEVVIIDEPVTYRVPALKRLKDVPIFLQRAQENNIELPYIDRYVRYYTQDNMTENPSFGFFSDIRDALVGKYRWAMLKKEETMNLEFIFVYSFDEDDVITEKFIIPATLQRWPTAFTHLRP